MQIPQDAHLYYITDLQLRRLKLVTAIVAREIEAQQYISDADEKRVLSEQVQEQIKKDREEFFPEDEESVKAHDLAMEMGDERA